MAEILAGVQPLDTVSAAAYRWTAAKGLVDNVLSDYLWAVAVLLTSPSVATVGMSLHRSPCANMPIGMISTRPMYIIPKSKTKIQNTACREEASPATRR